MAQGDVLSIIRNRPGNLLINGDFSIDQRFAGALNSSAGYTMDRWFKASGDSCQRVLTGVTNIEYAAEVISTAANNFIKQRIERANVPLILGKEITATISIKLVSGTWGVAAPSVVFGHATLPDDFSGIVDDAIVAMTPIDGGSVVPDGTFRRFKATTTVTQDMIDNGMYVQFGNFTSNTQTVQYAQAMLNQGPVPVQFELAGTNISNEILLCQRYFEKTYDLDTPPGTVTTNGAFYKRCNSVNSGQISRTFFYKVTKRTLPVARVYSTTGATGFMRNTTAGSDLVSTVLNFSEQQVTIRHSGAAVVDDDYMWHGTADAEL